MGGISVGNWRCQQPVKSRRLAALHRQHGNAAHLIAIRDAAFLTPGGLLRVAEEISASNVMVDADFSAAEAAEVLFRPIRACAVERVRFLMIDPLDFKSLMKVVP